MVYAKTRQEAAEKLRTKQQEVTQGIDTWGANQIGGGLQFVPAKTDRSRRTIPLTLGVRGALEMQKESVYGVLGMRQVAGSLWKEFNLTFPSTYSTPIDASKLTQRFPRVCEVDG